MSTDLSCSNSSFWFEVARIAVPSLLVIAGWVVAGMVQRATNSRQETRKDLRTKLDKLEVDLRSLRDLCIEYYVDAGKGTETAIPIQVAVEDIRRQSMLLMSYYLTELDSERVLALLTGIANAATGGSFESRKRVAIGPYDRQLLSLFHGSASLIALFEQKFIAIYPPKRI